MLKIKLTSAEKDAEDYKNAFIKVQRLRSQNNRNNREVREINNFVEQKLHSQGIKASG